MFRKLRNGILIGVSVTLFFSFLLTLGFFESWQNAASDKIFPKRPVREDIVIIAIDNESIEKVGRWPWTRTVFASILSKIDKGQPHSVGIDVAFLESETPESDQALAAEIAKLGNVTVAGELEGEKVLLPIPAIRSQANVGLANITPDNDGVARHAPLKATAEDGKVYYHFSVEVLRNYFESLGVSPSKLDSIPTEDNFIRINYVDKPNSFKSYPFVDVLEDRVVPANFRDKIVLIGATAPDLHDNQITPVSNGAPMDGVEIHSNIIQTILEDRYLFPETTSETILTTAFLAIALAVFLMYLPIFPAIIVMLVTLGIYVVYAIVSFDGGSIKHLIVPPLAIITTGVSDIVYKYFVEYRQKKYIRRALSYYLSGDVLSEILSDPDKLKLGGVRQEISVLFSDIAGFTSISEKMEPEALAHILNSYLTRMTNIVFENRGVLDKYIGDAVMAFWGAPLKTPNHALFACKSALEMFAEMDEIRAEWKKYDIHDFDIRIGINTGEMVVGNMGSEVRFDYTLLGDNVNLGSRLEGINKEYGTEIIISESTYKQVHDQVVARKLDTVAVKGKKTGIVIFELRGLAPVTDQEKAFLQHFEIARLSYEKGDFKKALSAFKALEENYPDDKPTKVYIERLKLLIKDPPTDWDGIFKATSK